MGLTVVLSREDYERFAEEHPELQQNIEDENYYGLKFKESKPTTENRAMRRAKKRKRAGD